MSSWFSEAAPWVLKEQVMETQCVFPGHTYPVGDRSHGPRDWRPDSLPAITIGGGFTKEVACSRALKDRDWGREHLGFCAERRAA